MAVKLSDIARELGLSEATVSLALNNKPVVKEGTRLLVQETARRMGYTPNMMAQRLAKKSSNVIGVVVPDVANPYYSGLIKACGQYIRSYGYDLVFAFSSDTRELEEQIIDNLISQRVAGVLLAPINTNNTNPSYIRRLEEYGIKCVFISSYYRDFDAPCVMVDLEKGSYLLIRYLLDMGHRDIFFLCSDHEMIPTLMRINGYRRAFAEYRLEVEESKFVNCMSLSYDSAYSMTQELIRSKNGGIDAIASINDMMALGAMRALLDNGIRIPDDISVVGYDNLIFSSIATIPITTVKQDIPRMCRAAVDTLFKLLKAPGYRADSLLIEPELILRGSTAKKA